MPPTLTVVFPSGSNVPSMTSYTKGKQYNPGFLRDQSHPRIADLHIQLLLMIEGKVSRAICLLSKGGILSLDTPVNRDDPTSNLVCDVLAEKHPPPGPVHPDSILLDHTPPPDHDPHFCGI